MARELQNQSRNLDDFVAELSEAAYPIALRRKGSDGWLDLQLDLWRALGETVQRWERRITQVLGADEAIHVDVRGGTKTPGAYAAAR